MVEVKIRSIAGAVPVRGPARGGGFERIEGSNHNLSGLGGSIDVGGAMSLKRDYAVYTYARHSGSSDDWYIANDPGMPGFLDPPADSAIKALGTTAIARTTPTSPMVSVPTLVGETVREGLPSLIGVQTWKKRTAQYRENGFIGHDAGSEFLNYQFGWLPLVNEVRSLCFSVRNQNKILDDFEAGSGKVTRVGYKFPGDFSHGNGVSNIVIGNCYTGKGTVSDGGGWSYETGTKQWFKGAFTYHLPVGRSQAAKAKLHLAYANRLLGLRMTPEVLWNLTPWTWALDWFGNTGDIIHNISSIGQDGLVLKYGYMMNHTRTYYHVRTGKSVLSNGFTLTKPGELTRIYESKKRFPSHPYFGFGATSGSLSATQSAILVALGMTKVR